MMRPLLLLSVALAMLPAARPALAAAEPAQAAARTHYDQGLTLVDQGDFEGALREFAAAYAARPNFAVLYNIGQAQIALGRVLEAVETLSDYLRVGQDQIPADRRQQVDVQVRLLESLLAELEVIADISGAKVSIDGREVGRTPLLRSVKLQTGTHKVIVASQDGSTVTRTVSLSQGEHQVLQVELPSPPDTRSVPPSLDNLPGHASSAVPTPLSARPPEVEMRGRGRLRSALPYTLAAVGVALGGGALGVYLWNRGRYDDWRAASANLQNEALGSAAYRQDAAANNQRAAALTSANHGIWGLSIAGGALVATGTVLFLLDRRSSSATSAVTVGMADGRLASLQWSGRW